MSEFLFCTIGFLIGYKFASLQVEKIVKREIERQIATFSDWTLKDED